ncbi:MAG: proton-conducting transporter membrane subunit [Candidatus Bipolaricaulota bacterium]|nr:proton-conducting transporter membrane subunit [Candidatus Bipolaricaulota bacterium]
MVAALLIGLPFLGAFLIPLVGLASKRLSQYIPAAVMLSNLGISLALLPQVMHAPIVISISGWTAPLAINFVVGPLGLGLVILISLVGFLVTVYGVGYIHEEPKEKYHILMLTLLTGATGMVLTGDIFNLFVFFEILSLSSYALTGYNRDCGGTEAAIKYLIQGSIGSAFILIGIALLYGITGTLNMADIAAHITGADPTLLFMAMSLLIVGFGVEAALFPLNAWLPDAHSSAPSSVSAILSGIAIETGAYAVARIVYTVFDSHGIMLVLAILGVVTLLLGEMSAFQQKGDVKRLLAYSSIGQMGLIMLAFGIASDAGVFAALFQLVSHTLAKALLFLATGYIIYRVGSKKLSALAGLGRKMPFTGAMIAVAVLSLVGVPPFAGFMSKFSIVRAALAQDSATYTGLIVLVLLATVIEVGYFMKLLQIMFFTEAETEGAVKELPLSALIPITILAALIIAIGVYPHIISGVLQQAANGLVERSAYIQSVLGAL